MVEGSAMELTGSDISASICGMKENTSRAPSSRDTIMSADTSFIISDTMLPFPAPKHLRIAMPLERSI